ncbi:MAG: DUF47 family protein [Coriobacteriia bacterium]|nr:DUF47 family protein [Coriobacteriia bacterium]
MAKDSKKHKGYDYFVQFNKVADVSVRIAHLLNKIFQKWDPSKTEERLAEMHELEQEADSLKHQMMEVLYKDFLPPLDRNDIIAIASSMDDIIDAIEDVAIRFDMYCIEEPHPRMIEFIELIVKTVEAQAEVVHEVKNFKKSKTLLDKIILVNDLEKQADVLYVSLVKELYSSELETKYILNYEHIYQLLEQCADLCEAAANCIEGVVLKNG